MYTFVALKLYSAIYVYKHKHATISKSLPLESASMILMASIDYNVLRSIYIIDWFENYHFIISSNDCKVSKTTNISNTSHIVGVINVINSIENSVFYNGNLYFICDYLLFSICFKFIVGVFVVRQLN